MVQKEKQHYFLKEFVLKENNMHQSSDISVLILIYHDSIANALVKLHSSRQLVRLYNFGSNFL